MPDAASYPVFVGRDSVRDMVGSITYTPSVADTMYAESLEQAARARRAEKDMKRAMKKEAKYSSSSDSASVFSTNSFGSTVGLLKSKIRKSDK